MLIAQTEHREAVPTFSLYWEGPEGGGVERYASSELDLAVRTAVTLSRNFSDTYVEVTRIGANRTKLFQYEPPRRGH